MTPCQKQAQIRKIRSYEQQAREAQKQAKEAEKRVKYFLGLITQLRMAMKEQ